jgi:release factor glutamine methyltransferase
MTLRSAPAAVRRAPRLAGEHLASASSVQTLSWADLLAEGEQALADRERHRGGDPLEPSSASGIDASSVPTDRAQWRRAALSREARWILEDVGGFSPAGLLGVLRDPAPEAAVERFRGLLAARLAGQPLQHVLGHASFRSLDLLVDRRVLVPRPETELLGGLAVSYLGQRRRATGRGSLALDLGTGSGALSLSLAVECDDLEIYAVDCSPSALAVARLNRDRLGVGARAVTLLCGSWYEPLARSLEHRFDLIVANPPYLAEHEWAELPAEVREFDPAIALVAGPTGLEAIGAVLEGATRFLAPGGCLLVEIAPAQKDTVRRQAESLGLVDVGVERDLSDRPRILRASAPDR